MAPAPAPADSTDGLVAAIANACYLVRYYRRPLMRAPRAIAIRELGLLVRQAFNASDDFERLLGAIVRGLSARDDEPPPF